MMAMAYGKLTIKFCLPSAIKTPRVTAGLKCPPQVSPKMQMFPKMVRPMANGYL